ncbi:low specificity L-threonine aldolase, partial [Clostridioides difficile]
MIRFECDYNEGAHERILQRLMETNMEQTSGYGTDGHCERARMLIRQACDNEQADVHFLVGGTQTNTTVIASILRPYQGVIAASSGHIAVHETGAIEATGHKVLTV